MKQVSHLLKYESTLGIFDAEVKPASDNDISVDGKISKSSLTVTPPTFHGGVIYIFMELGIDLVIKGTGVFVDKEWVGKRIEAGAKKMLIAAPGKGDIPTYFVGVNAELYNHSEAIISNAFRTTNCLAPFVKVIDQNFGNHFVKL
ncbi:putative glyceraldehyde-3-phosphate dehydrogenase (NADP(+)) (phosphorylating) [Helianthus annuus]|nr:putative glyceraldehyde-3-phosphate dehydrogenase (NADP(+)) (phosphorylating) [Helianthus annuus]KAJ0600042.1 putative glyceraldehyde-3-phosphate dehydrogenase (NADP(+)) (phosphorylating) [Helianthus annuus]KAJ0607463.1 putative glyceraldehyde-3-phosphate dehydrogenase (NADP(+)) (phosphorylating) [Helianthus annuus]KAJ0767518.1 putative glyceraldehyde-3-phosphate dehydrogenase (NADP(+)) (phosphorylating) [Helianthus annuus]KAJ0943021.1 putative glyceraldehyde-3-phosphate dehydrogenase (NADP(